MDRRTTITTLVVPHDHRAEQSVLGAILHNPDVLADIPDLEPRHFFHPTHASIFATLQAMSLAGEEIDSITLYDKLRESGELRKTGGAPYLSDLLQAFKTIGNTTAYARIIQEQWIIRKIQDFGRQCIDITESADDATLAVEAVHRLLDEVETGVSTDSEGFEDLFTRWETWEQSEADPAVATPWADINDVLNGGLNRGRLYVPVARPGAGKSVFGLNVALQAAQAGHSALVVSLEMSKTECSSRIISSGARVKIRDIFARSLTRDDYDKVQQFKQLWTGMNLTINDNPSHTIESIAAEARAHKKRHGLDVLFIDYAGLISASDPKMPRYQQMGHISKSCKLLARKLNCAVILACQANRSIDNEERLPRLSDARESGDIEADADCILFLSKGVKDQEGMVLAHVLKNRAGTPDRVIALANRFHVMRLGD